MPSERHNPSILRGLVQRFLQVTFPDLQAEVSVALDQRLSSLWVEVQGPWGNVQTRISEPNFQTLIYNVFAPNPDRSLLTNLLQEVEGLVRPFYEERFQTAWARILGEDDPFQTNTEVPESHPTEGTTSLDRILNDWLDSTRH